MPRFATRVSNGRRKPQDTDHSQLKIDEYGLAVEGGRTDRSMGTGAKVLSYPFFHQ
jgi:hypothetical protein